MVDAAVLPARGNVIARVLTPSLTDIFFVALIAWSFLSGPDGWTSLLMDGDTGFHIRLGDWIVQHHRAPVTHPFAFSVVGHDWIAFEWGAQAILSVVHSEWGLKGVTLGAALLIAGVFTILLRYMLWRGANPLIALGSALLAVSVCRIHFWARPHLFTWLFLVVALWLLERERGSPSRWTWVLPCLTAVWANLHGGFVLFLVLLAIWIVGVAAESGLTPNSRARVPRLLLIGGVSVVSCAVNPYGFRLVTHVAEFVSARWIMNMVDEFKSPQFRTEPLTVFMLLLFVSLALCGRLVRKRRFVEILWIVFLGYSALVSVRHAPIFAIVVTPILASELSELWAGLVMRSSKSGIARILDDVTSGFAENARTGVLCPAFAIGLALMPGLAWPSDFPGELFPTKLVAKHGAELAEARVFTSDQWADYLIYRNYPKQRVFMDAQHIYYGERHVKDYLAAMDGQPSWSTVLDRFRFDYVLCPGRAPIASLLRLKPGWKLVDESDGNLLFAAAKL